MNRLLYAIHKWISVAIFVQLAIWTVTGFFFACVPQKSLKSTPAPGAHSAAISSAPAVDLAGAMAAASPTTGAALRVELRGANAGPYFIVRGDKGAARIDASSGRVAPVTREEAEAIARSDQPGAPPVRETTRIEDAPPIEYRDCEEGECSLPAYRVALADAAGTVVYVDAVTGDVTTRRNDRWRTYDFLWSLHIMDYRGREDFNHPLILCAAGLAMATVASGVVLLGIKLFRWVRRRMACRPGF